MFTKVVFAACILFLLGLNTTQAQTIGTGEIVEVDFEGRVTHVVDGWVTVQVDVVAYATSTETVSKGRGKIEFFAGKVVPRQGEEIIGSCDALVTHTEGQKKRTRYTADVGTGMWIPVLSSVPGTFNGGQVVWTQTGESN